MKNTQHKLKRGDLFFAEFDNAIGSELSGPHPVVIVQNNKGNYHSPTVIGAAISSQIKKEHLPTHIILKTGPCAGSMVMTEQLHTLDKHRLLKYIGTLDQASMEAIDTAILKSLGLWGKEPELLCLCGKCVQNFRAVPGQSAWIANPYQVITEPCCYCGCRNGYDYWVTQRSRDKREE